MESQYHSSQGIIPPSRFSHSNKRSKRLSFKEIGLKHNTDKVTAGSYQRMYEHRLALYRDKPTKMLEIGLGCDMSYGPGHSYYTWLEYFSNVDLYYIEYDAACAALWVNLTEGATVFAGDQTDVSQTQSTM